MEAAAAIAALPSPHTDNMAATEEETHGSAASRRDQSEATASNAGSGSPLPTSGGAEPERAEQPRPRRLRLRATLLACSVSFESVRSETAELNWNSYRKT